MMVMRASRIRSKGSSLPAGQTTSATANRSPGRSDGTVFPLHGSAARPCRQRSSGRNSKTATRSAAPTSMSSRSRDCRPASSGIGSSTARPARRVSKDQVVNTSDQTVPTFLMYHMNIGGKWFDAGTRLEGRCSMAVAFPGVSARTWRHLLRGGAGNARAALPSAPGADGCHRRQGRCECVSRPRRCRICRSGATRRRPPTCSASSPSSHRWVPRCGAWRPPANSSC